MAAGFASAYGVEFAGGRMVLVRAARRGGVRTVAAAAADSEEARLALRSAAGEVARGTAALAAAAPAALTFVRRLAAPFASAAKAAKVWPGLLDVELPFPVESARCDFGVPRVAGGTTLALAAAIRTADLEAALEGLRAAGCEPTHCDAEAPALWDQQAAEAPPARPGHPRVLVWLGADHAVLVRGRGVEFSAAHVLRASPLADRDAFLALWRARAGQILNTHAAETGAGEIDVWWAGPGAADPDALARLRQAVTTGPALRHETHRAPETFLARALARRAADGTGVNFRTGDLAHPALVRREQSIRRRIHAGVSAAAVVVLLLNGLEGLQRRHRAQALRQELTAAARAIAGAAVLPGQEALMVERALPARDEALQPFRTALDPAGVEGRFTGIIDEAAALGVEISRLGLSSGTLALEGSAAGIQAIEALGERLRGQGWAIQSDSPGLTPEGRPRFILKGTASHEG